MKKSLIALILAVCLVMAIAFAFAACGEKPTVDNENKGDTQPQETPGGNEPEDKQDEHTCVFGAWETVTEANCTQDGLRKRYCTVEGCDKYEEEVIAAKGHTPYEDEGVAPTCTTDGRTPEKYCSVCGICYNNSSVVSQLGHDIGEQVIAPTEYEEGYTLHACSRCDYSYSTDFVLPAKSARLDFRMTDDGYYSVRYMGEQDESITEVIIPSKHEGTDVKYLQESAFRDSNYLVSVYIPDSVVSIGKDAFYSCDRLANVRFGASLQSVGKDAFQYDYAIEIVRFAGDLEAWCNVDFATYSANPVSGVLYIQDEQIVHLVVPESVTEVKPYTFKGCKSIVSATLHAGVTAIGEDAFSGCVKLVEVRNLSSLEIAAGDYTNNGKVATYAQNVYSDPDDSHLWNSIDGFVVFDNDGTSTVMGYAGTKADPVFPEKVQAICQYALYGNNVIETLVLGEDVTSIAGYAFCYCPSLANVIFNAKLQSIGSRAFYQCGALQSVILPDSLQSIGEHTFYDCDAITTVSIGNGVKYVGEYVFAGCDGVTSITIGSGVTGINHVAFGGCTSVTDVYYNGSEEGWNNVSKARWDEDFGDYQTHFND